MPSFSKPLFQEFNFGLALSLGVVALFVVDRDGRSLVDLITGTTFNFGANATVVNTPEGLALHFNGSQHFTVDHPAVDGGGLSINYGVIARARPTAAQPSPCGCIFGVGHKTGGVGAFGVGWDNTATPKAGITSVSNGGAGMVGGASGVRTTGVNVFSTNMGSVGDSGVTNAPYVDGTPLNANTSGAATIATPTTISFGSHASNGTTPQPATGDLLWGAIIKTDNTARWLTNQIAWQLFATDFPYNLFRPSRQPWRLAGGNIYNVSISESGSAADIVDNTATLPSAVNDNATAADIVTSAAILPSSVSDGLSAADTVSNTAILPSTIAEVASASDSPSTPGGNSTVTDALSATDQYSSTVNVNSAMSDGLTATNTQNAAGLVASATVTETANAVSTQGASLVAASAVGETVSAFDAYLAVAIYNSSVADALTATDIYTASAGVIKPGKCDSLDVPFIVRSLQIPAIVRSLGVGCA